MGGTNGGVVEEDPYDAGSATLLSLLRNYLTMT